MRKLSYVLFALAMVALSGCSVITGIFKAGVAVGIIAVIIIVAIIIWIIAKVAGK
jgi:hypothetical protein